MTRLQKNMVLFLILLSFLLKDKIISSLTKWQIWQTTENNIMNAEKDLAFEKYQELLNSYQYNDLYSMPLENTKILYQTPYNLNKTITIYKGTNSSIEVNNLVVNDKGLVGIISKVSKSSSEFIPLLNENISLPVKINATYGTLKYSDSNLLVTDIKNSAKVEIGDEVYTSDYSVYPEKIYIGKVEKINIDSYEIEKTLIISPAVDFNNLNYLSVIKIKRSEEN